MKKIIAILLALTVLFAFAACGGAKTPTDAGTSDVDVATVITKMYEANAVELPVMTESVAVDLADADAVKAYTGLGSAEGIKEAYFSETTTGAQAYSLVVVSVEDEGKVEETKKSMLDGIDTRKWICVEANSVRVASAGNVVMLIMVDKQFGETIADDMVKAFESVAGTLTGETLKLDK